MCDHCGCRQGSIGELMDQHDRIGALGDEVRRALAAGDLATARSRLEALVTALEPHVAWEEVGLFSRLVAHGEYDEHVAALEDEHAALFAVLDAAEDDPAGWPAAVTAALEDLDRHIYRENFGLFPGAIAVLEAEDWDAIEQARPGAFAA